MLLSFFSSCTGKRTDIGDAITERDSMPFMRSLDVTTFISDSGWTRYKVVTDQWDIYDRKRPPYWAFEKGVYLEKFDTLFNIEASIKADTAYYYNEAGLWKLIGNVHIQNLKGETFDTELMYWNQKKETVYSDAFIKINQIDRLTYGYGFESDQQMVKYKIFNIQGQYYFNDVNAADSTNQP